MMTLVKMEATVANPSKRTTVKIGDLTFNAISAHCGVTTLHDGMGMPQMGTAATTFSVTADINDTKNVTFGTLRELFELANVVTREKIKEVKITFWADELGQDAICAYSFRGWLSSFFTVTDEDNNHIMSLTLEPELSKEHYKKIVVSN